MLNIEKHNEKKLQSIQQKNKKLTSANIKRKQPQRLKENKDEWKCFLNSCSKIHHQMNAQKHKNLHQIMRLLVTMICVSFALKSILLPKNQSKRSAGSNVTFVINVTIKTA